MTNMFRSERNGIARCLVALLVAAIGVTAFGGTASAFEFQVSSAVSRPCGADSPWTATITATSGRYDSTWSTSYEIGGIGTPPSSPRPDTVPYVYDLGSFPASTASVTVTVSATWFVGGGQVGGTRTIQLLRPDTVDCTTTTTSTTTTSTTSTSTTSTSTTSTSTTSTTIPASTSTTTTIATTTTAPDTSSTTIPASTSTTTPSTTTTVAPTTTGPPTTSVQAGGPTTTTSAGGATPPTTALSTRLPETGAGMTVTLLTVATLLVVTGSTLLLVRRRT